VVRRRPRRLPPPPLKLTLERLPARARRIVGLLAVILLVFHVVWLVCKYALRRKLPDADDAVAAQDPDKADSAKLPA